MKHVLIVCGGVRVIRYYINATKAEHLSYWIRPLNRDILNIIKIRLAAPHKEIHSYPSYPSSLALAIAISASALRPSDLRASPFRNQTSPRGGSI